MTKGNNTTFFNEFIKADSKARRLEKDLQNQFIRDRDIIRDLEQKRDNLQLSVVELKRQIVELQKTQTILKRKMSENEDKYHDTVLDLEAKAKDNENMVLKVGQSLQVMFMLGPKPMSFYDPNLKHGLGDTEDILDDATKSQIKMENKLKDPIAIEKKQIVRIIDYNKLNALYEDFVPQKELSTEQKYFSSTFIPSENHSNAKVRAQYQDLLITISELKAKLKNVEKGLKAASSVRRPSNRDSPFKSSVLSNTKKSSEKVEVSVKKNKKTYVASKNVVSNKKIVTNVDVKNALKAKDYWVFLVLRMCLSRVMINVVQIILWIIDSGCSKHMIGDHSLLKNFVEKFMGTVRFGNDHFDKPISLGQFWLRVVHLEVAFRFNTCYVRNLEGDDLLTGARVSNLYTISISDMVASSPVCLLSKATSIKSCKDHLCSACEWGKIKKSSHQPKLVPSTHSKLELLHMDLCGPMRVATINGKKYILVIIDDYSQLTWVYFLHTKDGTPEIIKKFIAQVQLNYNAKVYKIRTDNGTEFKNATLKAHNES
ncbi:integrase, catalytic region, zinc finger, CCHC-type containing protein [Tanacetum coccineum]